MHPHQHQSLSISCTVFFHSTEVRSLCPANFGECVFVFRFTANFVSLSFSPSGKYIVIGLRCKKRLKFAYILDKDTRWKIGVDFRYDLNGCESRDADTSLPNGKCDLFLCLFSRFSLVQNFIYRSCRFEIMYAKRIT